MAKRKSRRKKKSKTSFLTDKRFHFALGLLMLGIAVFTFMAFISYLFTWQTDFNKGNLSFFEFFSPGVEVGNKLGKLGAAVAVTFMHKWLGLGSFGLVVIIALIGLRLMNIKIKRYKAIILHTIVLSLLISATLSLFSGPGAFPLGGFYGELGIEYIKSYIGGVGTVMLVLLLIFLYLTFAFENFLTWTGKKIKDISDPEKIKNLTEKITSATPKIKIKKQDKQITETPVEKFEIDDEEKDSEIIEDEQELNPFSKITEAVDNPDNFIQDNDGVKFEVDLSGVNDQASKSGINMEVARADDVQVEAVKQDFDPTRSLPGYEFPPIDLLNDYVKDIDKDRLIAELKEKKQKIIQVLKNFKIEITKINAQVGPTVTLYEIVPAPGIPISKIKRLEEDIAMNLAALGIRIIAPMPGRGTIGIEVPNENPTIVSLKEMLLSPEYQNKKMELPIALGRDTVNQPFVFDLTKAPHVLMAGSTGEGKSVAINVIINSILFKKHPALVKFVMIDPKQVELSLYSRLEYHYLAKLPDSAEPIVTDVKEAGKVLKSLITEMEDRYRLLKLAQVRDIKEYNQKYIKRRLSDNDGHRFMPYIVTVIDEFADLVMVGGKEIEYSITRLSQKARAIGIHLVIATQRPSTDVVTGLIKNNFPTRIALKVMSVGDSKTIIDTTGANQLIGKGDMLYLYGSHLKRLQCAFISTEEVDRVTKFIAAQQGYPYPFELPEPMEEEAEGQEKTFEVKKLDKLFAEAARLVVSSQYASISLLQRKLEVGFNRAARIIDQLEAAGIVGPGQGSKARDVLVHDMDELEHLLREWNVR